MGYEFVWIAKLKKLEIIIFNLVAKIPLTEEQSSQVKTITEKLQ